MKPYRTIRHKSLFGADIHCYRTLPSTNAYLRRAYAFHRHGDIVWTWQQTHGKGRHARLWHSTSYKDLSMSFLIREADRVSFRVERSAMALVAALSLRGVLSSFGVRATLKWPNDLLVDGNKIAGILVESFCDTTHFMQVVGVGLNVNSDVPKKGLTERVASMKSVLGRSTSLVMVIKKFRSIFESSYALFMTQALAPFGNILKECSDIMGKNISYYTAEKPNVVLHKRPSLEPLHGEVVALHRYGFWVKHTASAEAVKIHVSQVVM